MNLMGPEIAAQLAIIEFIERNPSLIEFKNFCIKVWNWDGGAYQDALFLLIPKRYPNYLLTLKKISLFS